MAGCAPLPFEESTGVKLMLLMLSDVGGTGETLLESPYYVYEKLAVLHERIHRFEGH